MEEYSYTSTHPLGHTGSATGTLYLNPLTPNDHYCGRTAPITSTRCIAYIYSTNIATEYFKHGIYSPFFFSLQNAVCFIILIYLVPVLFTFYIQDVLKLKKNNNSGAQRLDCGTMKFVTMQLGHCIVATNGSVFASRSLLPAQETSVRVAGCLTFPLYSLPELAPVTRRQHCCVQSHSPTVQ